MKNNDFNFINKDIIQLDTPEGPKYDIFAQSGRSMVEMLGVLAVIGVLSIGGIMGYNYGMDKYRANQTINDISLRTVDLLTQASQGRTELSLAEWDKETTIYDFANPAYVEGENLFAFDVGVSKKIPQSVCQMVFDGLSNTAVQIDINDSVATSQDNCGNDNTMTFYFEGGGNGTGGETGEQCGDTICGTCQKCDSTTETCKTVSDYEQKCTIDAQSGWCVSGTCKPDTICNCEEGYYCADKEYYGGSCTFPTPDGHCVKAKPLFIEDVIDGTTYYISPAFMTWWDAVSACKALGNKTLLSHHEITIPCKYPDDAGCTSAGTKLNALGEELKEKYGGGPYPFLGIWSRVLYNSCAAYAVALENGYADGLARNTTERAIPICK